MKHITCIDPPKGFALDYKTNTVYVFGGVFKIIEDEKILNMNNDCKKFIAMLKDYKMDFSDYDNIFYHKNHMDVLLQVIKKRNRRYIAKNKK